MDKEIPTDFTEYKQMRVDLTPDKEGYIGRKCPSCGEYFKIVFDPKLLYKNLICPYCECGHKDNVKEFITQEQAEYAVSVAASEVFTKFAKNLRKSLQSSNNFKPSKTPIKFPIKHYNERSLETDVICDNCGLKFSIYGVFSNCPYCGQLNAKVVFDKSIESLFKKLNSCKDESLDPYDKDDHKRNALIGGVSAFDALGKPLRVKYSKIIPSKPKNLFQNLDDLNKVLHSKRGKYIADYIYQDNFEFLYKMFQVRHIYDHNAGVIDDDFIRNMSKYDRSYQLGRIYSLTEEEIEKFLNIVQDLGTKIFYEFEKDQKQEEHNS